MKVNKCYVVMKDPNTVFLIEPNEIIIVACNTHSCPYTLTGDKIAVSTCAAKTSNTCSSDKGEKYSKLFEESKSIMLKANIEMRSSVSEDCS